MIKGSLGVKKFEAKKKRMQIVDEVIATEERYVEKLNEVLAVFCFKMGYFYLELFGANKRK